MSRSGECLASSGDDGSFSRVEVKSFYALESRSPLIELKLGHSVVHLEPEQALELSGQLVRAAAVNEADAFIFNFAQAELGVDELAAALLLRQFRAWRLAREGATQEGVSLDGALPTSIDESTARRVASFLASNT